MSAPAPTIRVQVVWATAAVQDVVAVDVPAGTTVAQAVAASGLVAAHGIDGARITFGIGGRRAPAAAVLADGDRIELCRPLVVAPEDARRRRAEDRPLPRPRPRPKRPRSA